MIMKGNICFSNLVEQNVTLAITSKCHITHVSGALFVPNASLHIKQCTPWPLGGSVWCVNYIGVIQSTSVTQQKSGSCL